MSVYRTIGPLVLFFSAIEERRSKKSKYAANVDYDADLYDEDSTQDADVATGGSENNERRRDQITLP